MNHRDQKQRINSNLRILSSQSEKRINIVYQQQLYNQYQQPISKMTVPQICLSLEKIVFPEQFSLSSCVQIHILTDSGFSHQISARRVKNKTVNLFEEKIFLERNTKQILFDILDHNSQSAQRTICGFLYDLEKLTAQSKKKVLKSTHEFYGDFRLSFTIKLHLQLDNDTLGITERDFSDVNTPRRIDTQVNDKKNMDERQNWVQVSRAQSPNNADAKLLTLRFNENWQVKSDLCPSKSRRAEEEQSNNGLRKKNTDQSLTLQSQSVKIKQRAPKRSHQKEELIRLKKVRLSPLNSFDDQKSKFSTILTEALKNIKQYKNSLLFGGIVGLASAFFGNSNLIF